MKIGVSNALRLCMIGLVFLIAVGALASATSFHQISERLQIVTSDVLPTYKQAAAITELVRQIETTSHAIPTAATAFEVETSVFQLRELTQDLRAAIQTLEADWVSAEDKAGMQASLTLVERTVEHLHGLKLKQADRRSQIEDGLAALRAARTNLMFGMVGVAGVATGTGVTGIVSDNLDPADHAALARRLMRLVDVTNMAIVKSDPTDVARYRQQFNDDRQSLLEDPSLSEGLERTVRAETAQLAPLFDARLEALLLDLRIGAAIERLVIMERLVAQVNTITDQIAALTRAEIAAVEALTATRTRVVMAVAGLSLLLALTALAYVNRRVVARMSMVQAMMHDHVAGGRDTPMPHGDDEITEMARSFRHFVKTADDRTAEVRRQSDLIRAVLDSMTLGVAAYDTDLRLIAWNRQFVEILGYPESLVHHGAALRDLISYDIARGEFGPGDPDEQLEMVLAAARRFMPHAIEQQRIDGRYLEVSGGPIEGGGLVSTFADITERKRTERALTLAMEENRRQSERFRNLTSNLPAMIFQFEFLNSGALLISYASPFMREVFALADTTDETILTRRVIRAVHPEDRARMRAALKAVQTAAGEFHETFRIVVKDSAVRWVEAAARPYRTAGGAYRWDGLALDITERRAAEHAVRESRETLMAVMESSPVGATIVTKDDRIAYANPAMASILGRSREDLLAVPPRQHYADPAERESIRARFFAGETIFNEDVAMRRADGTVIHTLLTLAPSEDGSRHFGWIYDITERKQAEDVVRAKVEELEQFTRLAVGRELRMIALKQEINALCEEQGQPPRYEIPDDPHGRALLSDAQTKGAAP